MQFDELCSRLSLAHVLALACVSTSSAHSHYSATVVQRADAPAAAAAASPLRRTAIVHNDVPYTKRFLVAAFARHPFWELVERPEATSKQGDVGGADLPSLPPRVDLQVVLCRFR